MWFLHAVGRHVDGGRRPRPRRTSCRAALHADHRSPPGRAHASASASTATASSPKAPKGGRSRGWTPASTACPSPPAPGKPVEVNALWVNGLRMVAQLLTDLKRHRVPTESSRRPTSRPARSSRTSRATAAACSTSPTPTTARCGRTNCLAASLPLGPVDDPRRSGRHRARVRPARHRRSGCGRSRPFDTRFTGRHRGDSRRPRPRLPPGHGVAVDDRAVRRRLPRARASRPAACSTGCSPTCANGGSARCRRPLTATRRTARPDVRSRRGRSPSCCGPSAASTDRQELRRNRRRAAPAQPGNERSLRCN